MPTSTSWNLSGYVAAPRAVAFLAEKQMISRPDTGRPLLGSPPEPGRITDFGRARQRRAGL